MELGPVWPRSDLNLVVLPLQVRTGVPAQGLATLRLLGPHEAVMQDQKIPGRGVELKGQPEGGPGPGPAGQSNSAWIGQGTLAGQGTSGETARASWR